jgi:hypothetical protein
MLLIIFEDQIKAERAAAAAKRDEEARLRVVANSHPAMRDGRPPPIPEEPVIPKEKVEGGHEKSVLQAKLTKLAIQIGYAGNS